jgi:hypothetical protein
MSPCPNGGVIPAVSVLAARQALQTQLPKPNQELIAMDRCRIAARHLPEYNRLGRVHRRVHPALVELLLFATAADPDPRCILLAAECVEQWSDCGTKAGDDK